MVSSPIYHTMTFFFFWWVITLWLDLTFRVCLVTIFCFVFSKTCVVVFWEIVIKNNIIIVLGIKSLFGRCFLSVVLLMFLLIILLLLLLLFFLAINNQTSPVSHVLHRPPQSNRHSPHNPPWPWWATTLSPSLPLTSISVETQQKINSNLITNSTQNHNHNPNYNQDP